MKPKDSVGNAGMVGNGRSIQSVLRQLPIRIAEMVDHFFYRIGYRIAVRPIRWLVGCTFVVLVCLSGLFFFRQEKNPLKLWVPPDSRFVRDTEWLLSHFHEGLRMETVILIADDIFEPDALLKLNEITREIVDTQSPGGISWTDVCYKVPTISGIVAPGRRRRSSDNSERPNSKRKRDIDLNHLDKEQTDRLNQLILDQLQLDKDKFNIERFRPELSNKGATDDFFEMEPGENISETTFEPSVHADPKLYCAVVNHLPRTCLMESVLDVFEYEDDVLRSGSRDGIMKQLIAARVSPSLGHPLNFSSLIGGWVMNENGTVQSARAVKSIFLAHNDFAEIDAGNFGNDAGTADWATPRILEWERSFLDTLHRVDERLREENSSVRVVYEAGRSFGDISSATIFQDVDKVLVGACLMFVYVLTILSRRNWVELRFCLTGAGLLCIAGAFIIAVGLCSILGIPYGPVHTSLPFMLLALGVDDIFVMMASWRQVHAEPQNREKPLPERIGLMLGHAGSAICITSLTDVIAFVIGASTILPSLQSFCIYAAVGVLVTFLLQLTFFVGFFTLDCRRIDAKRNGALPCLRHPEFTRRPSSTANTVSTKAIDTLYNKVILTIPGRALVLVGTLALTCFGILGSTQLQQWFDPHWFLPRESYLARYREARTELFAEHGYEGFLLMGDFNYTAEFAKLLEVTRRFQELETVQTIEPWPQHFLNFVQKYYQKDLSGTVLPEEEFQLYLSKFLYSRAGGKFQGNFQFNGNLTCGEPAPRIELSTVDFSFKRFTGPHEWVPAMDQSLELMDQVGIKGFATVWCRYFSLWVTDKLIAQEVLRNLLLALVCVMGMTSVLIMEPQTCFWILLCVLLTLLDVCGFMHFWGLTIDVVSCIGLELSIGLSVDYAAHVAHGFLTAEPPADPTIRKDSMAAKRHRVQSAVRHIGAAVAYGAGSTSIALSMLVFSDAYVFRTFFKIFLLVIVFGLWHGLVLLPVVLSLLGPRSVKNSTEPGNRDEEEQKPLNRLNGENSKEEKDKSKIKKEDEFEEISLINKEPGVSSEKENNSAKMDGKLDFEERTERGKEPRF